MKLNRTWTDRGNGQALDRPMGDVVYRIKYEGNEKVNIRRRIVHHNQENLKRRIAYTENPQKRENELAETTEAVIVTPPVEDDAVQQNSEGHKEQPCLIGGIERPQRERRPPDWFVNYHTNF